MREAAACDHAFTFERHTTDGLGVVGRCTKCKCRFTTWPGGVHYEEIVEARERGKEAR